MRKIISVLFVVFLSANAAAATLLHCRLQQDETIINIQVSPTTDPYSVAALPINRFRFKAVVVGSENHIDYINLYTYYVSNKGATPRVHPLHEVKYVAPQPQSGAAPSSLTGAVYLYEPSLEREFSYDCALRKDEP
jgi:hypothetical protein